MRTLVVYESMYGNTRQVADAVAEGLSATGDGMDVEVTEVGSAPTEVTAELLVVGAPTHAFTLSRPETRQAAADQITDGQELVSQGIGLREWLDQVQVPEGTAAAVFTTRVRRPPLPAFTGRSARHKLQEHGCQLVTRPETFYVSGTPGPLLPGEAERARAWAEQLVDATATAAG
jgi:hypothetical protein